MIFVKEFTIPINTLSSNPAHSTLIISSGLIYKVEFQFPAGCAGLAGLMISDGGFQLWPATRGTWFRSDNFTIAFEDMYLKETDPLQLDLWGYNEDTVYNHTLFFRVGIADKRIYQARYLPNVAYELLQEELAKVNAEQEAQRQAVGETPFPWVSS